MPAQSSHSTLSDQTVKESTIRHGLLKLLLITVVLSVASILWLDLPEKIANGEQGQEAIQMLDAMRRPLLAIKAAELKLETEQDRIAEDRLSQAIEDANSLVDEYLSLAEYNEALLQSVRRFKEDYTVWAGIIRKQQFEQDLDHTNREKSVETTHHYPMTSDHFLRVMDHLGEGEAPIHHDIEEGRFATRVMALFLSAIILIQITAFIIQVIIKNSKLGTAREQLQHEIATREEAHARIDLLVNNMPGVIYLCQYDNHGAFIPTFCTPNIEKMMGYSPEDFYTKENFWAANIHPEDSPKVFENYERLFQENRLCIAIDGAIKMETITG